MRNSITVLTVPLVAVILASPELRAVKDCFYVPHAIVPLLYMRMELETERNDEVEHSIGGACWGMLGGVHGTPVGVQEASEGILKERVLEKGVEGSTRGIGVGNLAIQGGGQVANNV